MPASHHRRQPLSQRAFAAFLRLFPREFRHHFGTEMEAVFRAQQRDAQAFGRGAQARFWLETAGGLLVTAVRQHCEILLQDIAYALRMMRKNPAFTAVSVGILGLAIGAGAAAFTAANAILIQPLPFAGGNRLLHLQQRQPSAGVQDLRFSVPELQDYRSQSQTLDQLIEYHEMPFTLLGGRKPERVDTGVVSANFFQVLGITPLYGRGFIDDDDLPNAPPVLILSYQAWQRSFGGDPAVVGRTFTMNDKQHVVVGVLPPLPQFPEVVDVYMPTAACPSRSSPRTIHDRQAHMVTVFATLKPAATMAQVASDLDTIAGRLKASYPQAYPAAKGYGIGFTPVRDELTSDIQPVLVALVAATFLLLLLACANVAGLMLSRMLARARELTVRSALGATQTRIVRSFLTEGIVLAAFGGVLGLLLAFWSLSVLVRFTAIFTTLSSQLHMGWQVIAFALLLSLACGLVIGIVPAVVVRRTPFYSLQVGNSISPGRVSSRTRALLVGAQLAFSIVLLVGAGLTLRSLIQLEHVDGGFEPSGVMTARLYVMNPKVPAIFDALLDKARRLPGVQSVALASTFPLYPRGTGNSVPFEVQGEADPIAQAGHAANLRVVTPDYFRTLEIPLVTGRGFTPQDSKEAVPVVIINQHLAQHYWTPQTALGKQLAFWDGKWRTVIGVVGDVRQYGLDKAPVDEAYGPLAQYPNFAMSLLIRTAGDSSAVARAIGWIVHGLDPNAVVTDVQPMAQVRANSLASPRTTTLFLAIFAMVALCITASGISGMMALVVGERKHEIGIRLALGATAPVVMRTMMKQALALILAGLGSGLAVAWLISASMSRLVFGIPPRDALTFAAASILLVLVAAASSFLPLTRVAQLDPVVLLKTE